MSAVVDYADQATRLLATQFSTSENFKKLLRVLSGPFQELEIVFQQLKYLRAVDKGDGAQLDVVGSLLDLPRGGLDDVNYRQALRLRVIRNICQGDPNSIIEYARRVANATIVEYTEGEAAINIGHNGDVLALTVDVVKDVTPAGVGVTVEFITPGG